MRRLLCRVWVPFVLMAPSCSPPETAHLYQVAPAAPGYAQADIAALKYLGPTFAAQGVNFGVYSHNATRVDLLLFDNAGDDKPARTVVMSRFGDVWNTYVQGVGVGQLYGFRAWGPNWPEDPNWFPGSIYGFLADVDANGNRFDPNKLLMDPYAKAVTGDHNWSIASVASGPGRTQETYAAAAKSIVVKSKYVWAPAEKTYWTKRQDPTWVGHRAQDAIIYETHPKGFTASSASNVVHPGTFRGIGEKADYLADLGITAVELMPVMLKPNDGGYWGYNTLLFFVPNFDFTVGDPDPASHIDEFKWMVEQLHQRNIEVILDVVYNHTGEGGLWRDMEQYTGQSYGQLSPLDAKEVASLYSYRGLDNASYYAIAPDGTGEPNQAFCTENCGLPCPASWKQPPTCTTRLCNDGVTYGCGGSCNTGVGQETRPNNVPLQHLIVDSLHYWSQEMHVDGFRFDLAPVMAEEDLQPLNNALETGARDTVIQTIIDDPLLQQYNTRIIAEPWSLAEYGLSKFPAATGAPGVGWYEWNGNFRDLWREFVNYDGTYLPSGWSPPAPNWLLSSTEYKVDTGGTLTGSYNIYAGNGRKPYHSVNFITIHDGFTMYDLLSYDVKENLCGPLDEICCNNPTSPFCDPNSGDNNNRSRNWGQNAEPYKRQLMRDFFMAMMISEGTPLLLGGDEWMRTQLGNNNAYSDSADNSYNWYDWGTWEASDFRNRMHDFVKKAIQFRQSHTYAFVAADWGGTAPFAWEDENGNTPPNWGSRHLAMHFTDASKGPPLLVLLNMELGPVDYHLPAGNWARVIDTQSYFETNVCPGSTATADPLVSQNITLDAPCAVATGDYNVPSRTIVVLQAQ